MYYDIPIENQNEDILNRTPFCESIAKQLLEDNKDSNHSFTVGLYGEWGSGKTSLLHLLVKEIEKQSGQNQPPIVFWFKPWNYTDKGQLLSQFFEQLLEKLNKASQREKFENISIRLAKYASAVKFAHLIPVIGQYLSAFSELMKDASDHFKNTADELRNTEVLKTAVEDALKEKRQRLVVIIDDLDRLSNDQICMIFQLVKAIADFPYMLYLLAFDRVVVARALEKEQNCDGEAYLEKIIQMLLPVPDMPKGTLRDYFYRELNARMDKDTQKNIKRPYWLALSPFILDQLATLRDIKRLLNAFQTQYQFVKKNINFVDLLAVVALQLFAPKAVDWILDNQDLLLGNNVDENLLPGKTPTEARDEIKKSLIAICPSQASAFMEFISNLFPWFGNHVLSAHLPYDLASLADEHRIAYPSCFHRYFSLATDPYEVSKSEMLEFKDTLNKAGLESYISKLYHEKRIKPFVAALSSFVDDVPDTRQALLFHQTLEIIRQYTNQDVPKYTLEHSLFDLCEVCAIGLLVKMSEKTQQTVLEREIADVSYETLPMLADIIRKLHQNSLQAVHVPANTLDTYKQRLTEKIVELAMTNNWLDSNNSLPVLELLKEKDTAAYNDFMKTHMKDPMNIAKIISIGTTQAANPDEGFRYKALVGSDVLADDEAYQSIMGLIKNKEFLKLPENIKLNSAAFALKHQGKQRLGMDNVREYVASIR